MSIASEITRITDNIADAYTAANSKGATMPVTQNSDNLASTIATISGGVTPTGTINITNNGTYDVTSYASASVAVPSSAPNYYIELKNSYGTLQHKNSSVLINLNGVTNLDNYVCAGLYYYNNALSGNIDLSSLTALSGTMCCRDMFRQAPARITSIDLSSLTTISGTSACESMFEQTQCTSVDLSSLTTISAEKACKTMFYYATSLVSANLSSLTTISSPWACGNMFQDTGLTSINLGSLTTISDGQYNCEYMFSGCTSLTSVNLDSLTTISNCMLALNNAFVSTSLNTVSFKSLSVIENSMWAFANCFSSCPLTSLYFPSLNPSFVTDTSAFTNDMLGNVDGCTIHFPSNMQTAVQSFQGYPNFGGTNITVVCDLPATNILTGADTQTYSRNPKHDTATALAWKVGTYGTTNFTPFYTSGTSDPAVSDTIYSDAACTTAVTTISSIA